MRLYLLIFLIQGLCASSGFSQDVQAKDLARAMCVVSRFHDGLTAANDVYLKTGDVDLADDAIEKVFTSYTRDTNFSPDHHGYVVGGGSLLIAVMGVFLYADGKATIENRAALYMAAIRSSAGRNLQVFELTQLMAASDKNYQLFSQGLLNNSTQKFEHAFDVLKIVYGDDDVQELEQNYLVAKKNYPTYRNIVAQADLSGDFSKADRYFEKNKLVFSSAKTLDGYISAPHVRKILVDAIETNYGPDVLSVVEKNLVNASQAVAPTLTDARINFGGGLAIAGAGYLTVIGAAIYQLFFAQTTPPKHLVNDNFKNMDPVTFRKWLARHPKFVQKIISADVVGCGRNFANM